jgi:hypothetical protein
MTSGPNPGPVLRDLLAMLLFGLVLVLTAARLRRRRR